MDPSPVRMVVERDGDGLVLGDLYGRYEIAVTGHDHSSLDLASGRVTNEIYG